MLQLRMRRPPLECSKQQSFKAQSEDYNYIFVYELTTARYYYTASKKKKKTLPLQELRRI
jgi:hypothetical protein